MNINDFALMKPMKYYDNPEPKTAGAAKKRLDMINDDNHLCLATIKHDGDWGCLIHYSKGNNLIRSRSLSKVTGVYGDYTAKLPRITAAMDEWPDNTVVLAELCFDEPHASANTAGSILRCLPEKAVERQQTKPLHAVAFDFLMCGNEDFTSIGYGERFKRLKIFLALHKNELVYPTISYEDNFAEHADSIIAAGGEGLVLQLKTNAYCPDTRTAWKTLKLKQSMPHLELKVVGTLEPNKLYDGIEGGSWPYALEDGTLVTKPYYYHWKNGITVDYNGVKVDVASGLSDDDRQYLATDEAQALIKDGKLYAEIKAMQENSRGSLRHPCLVRLRDDYE